MKSIIFILCFFASFYSFSQTIDINDYYLDSVRSVNLFPFFISQSCTKYSYDEQFRISKEQRGGQYSSYTYDDNKTTIEHFKNNGELLKKEEFTFNEDGEIQLFNYYIVIDSFLTLYLKDSFLFNSQNKPTNFYQTDFGLEEPFQRAGFTKIYDNKNRLEFEESFLLDFAGTEIIHDTDVNYFYNEQDRLIQTEVINNLDNSISGKVITDRFFVGSQLDSVHILTKNSIGWNILNSETFTYLEAYELKYDIFKQFYLVHIIEFDTIKLTKSYPSNNVLSEYSKIQEFKKNNNNNNDQFELEIQTLFSESLSDDLMKFTHLKTTTSADGRNSALHFFYSRKYPYEEPDSSYTSLETTLFPNPVKSNSRFAIESPEVFDYILIYNNVGQFIKKVNLVSDQDFVAPSLPGVYFILLINENNKVFFNTLRLVVIE